MLVVSAITAYVFDLASNARAPAPRRLGTGVLRCRGPKLEPAALVELFDLVELQRRLVAGA